MRTPSTTQSRSAPETGVLRAQQLYCERDDRVLFAGLDFALQPGELLQVKGSNGSGKTTLLRIICGLNDNFEGALFWQQQPLPEVREEFLASLLYIGHKVGVNKVLSPRENLRWSTSLQAGTRTLGIEEALALTGLAGYEDVPCHNLSAGQQQRVSLARLHLSQACLWVLDEPFTTLDVHGVAALEALLDEHVRAGGMALVTTHHRLQLACSIRELNLDTASTQGEVV
ncbi:MAG: cytochrome c biogenesis heme-transporting ATPase CcmA [Pseudomonadales bacterium]|nr:cytochrome c biogenesis heme-transporting ATPase CcmA [Pseudomonadales bacterium]